MFATLFDDPALINTMLPRYLAVTAEAIREAAAAGLPAGQPAGADLPARRPRRPTTSRCPMRTERRPTRRRRHERGAGPTRTTWSSPSGPTPGAPRPYEFPSVGSHRLVERPDRSSIANLPGPAAGVGVGRGPRTVPSTSRAELAGQHGPRRPGAVRGHGALRRHRAGRGRRAAGRLAPRRRRLGRHQRERRRPGRPARAGPRARSPRSCSDPTFPASEVERLRDERLNDLLQAQADPRRRAEEAFADTIYAPASPYHRPSGGTPRDGRAPDRRRSPVGLRARPGPAPGHPRRRRGPRRPGRRRAGRAAVRRRGAAPGRRDGQRDRSSTRPRRDRRIVRVVHRPGSVQTEIRIGHRGLPRRIPDFHAVSVMSAILGGLFNSPAEHEAARGEGLHLRRRRRVRPAPRRRAVRGAGRGEHGGHGRGDRSTRWPSSTACATSRSTRPSWPPPATSWSASSRFGSRPPGAVVGALSGLAVHGLPIDELIDYRARIEAVDEDAVAAAARAHLHVDRPRSSSSAMSTRSAPSWRRPAWARSSSSATRWHRRHCRSSRIWRAGPVDRDDEEGPTAGAEEPELPGVSEPSSVDER